LPAASCAELDEVEKQRIKRRPAGETPNGPRRVGLEIAKADYTESKFAGGAS
jgi:hypothetical protein